MLTVKFRCRKNVQISKKNIGGQNINFEIKPERSQSLQASDMYRELINCYGYN